MKISVVSYSFDQYIREGKMTQFDCVSKAKEMGFDAIEFTEISGAPDLEVQKENARKIKKEADKLGIEISAYLVGTHLYDDDLAVMEDAVKYLKDQVDIARILGTKIMRHDVCVRLGREGKNRSFELMLPYIAENTRKVTEYAEALGIKTCTENHGFIVQDGDRVEKLFNTVNHNNYGILLDTANFLVADVNPVEAVSRLAWDAVHVHVKDMLYRNEASETCFMTTRGANYIGGVVIGEGDVPVKKCLRILKQAGYNGYLSVEYEGAEDCISGICRSQRNLLNILADIDWI